MNRYLVLMVGLVMLPWEAHKARWITNSGVTCSWKLMVAITLIAIVLRFEQSKGDVDIGPKAGLAWLNVCAFAMVWPGVIYVAAPVDAFIALWVMGAVLMLWPIRWLEAEIRENASIKTEETEK